MAVVGRPQKSWRYYVLVGAYDGFGPGFLREIRPEPGDWHFGGATMDEAPRVLDLLAPDRGKYAQERQLQPGKDGIPVLYPVNMGKGVPWGYLGAAAFGAVSCGASQAPDGDYRFLAERNADLATTVEPQIDEK